MDGDGVDPLTTVDTEVNKEILKELCKNRGLNVPLK